MSLIAAVLGASLMIGPKWSSADATPVTKARRFPSAASGSPALFEAVQDGHQYAMHKILGADDLASCGDDTRDRREIMFRRIGADEATAVEVCRAAVEAARRNVTRTGGTDPVARYAEALVDAARASGGPAHRATPDDEPFYGYRFIVLDNGGITVVAYPAEYRSTGVMTFIVGPDAIVYERDLGPDTARIARTLKARPASGWRVVDSGLT